MLWVPWGLGAQALGGPSERCAADLLRPWAGPNAAGRSGGDELKGRKSESRELPLRFSSYEIGPFSSRPFFILKKETHWDKEYLKGTITGRCRSSDVDHWKSPVQAHFLRVFTSD